jgi:exopolysaccharide production protein ExoQ
VSTSAGAINASSLALERIRLRTVPAKPFAAWLGYYYSVRLLFPLLAVRVLRLDPQDGVATSFVVNFGFLTFAVLQAFGAAPRTLRSTLRLPCVPWVVAFIAFSGASLLWSVAASRSAAAAFWCAMAADTLIVLLLLRDGMADAVADSLMRGFVWGSCTVAVVAWLLPRQSDLRLGDEELLGPNQIGWACAFAFFLAQYFIRKKARAWILPAVLLAVTLLRSLSKTTIVAFVAGQTYILLRDRDMNRRTKLLIGITAVLVIIGFSSLLSSYYTVYINAGNQSETLTGRVGIWLYILNEAVQRPWIGHGFHSVWKVIPPFGEFEARHAHNELLQQFYAYGAVGVCLLVMIYGSVWRQLRYLDSSREVFFTGMLLFVIVRGLADTEPFDLSLPLWFIAIIGALVEYSRRSNGVTV